jgi:hypothetical protein
MTRGRRHAAPAGVLIFLASAVPLPGAPGTPYAGPQAPPPPAREPAALEPALQARLAAWLDGNGLPPQRYVAGVFATRDVVFLGEQHRIRNDPLLVQSLLGPLHRVGVRFLATEFARREDQGLIDALLAKATWDEGLAREILFRRFVWWGYQEYVDVLRAAWEVNRGLPPGAASLRVLGINCSPDWSVVKTPADREDPEVKRAIWRGCGEAQWAEVILEAVRAGGKVLVHTGFHHAFTKYRQPVVIRGRFVNFDPDLRCGNHVHAALGDRVATVFLHAPWFDDTGYEGPMRHPADGIIDALMLAIGPRPVGFDIGRGPFGALPIRDAVYRHGYPDFRLGDICDGWIYTRPLTAIEGATPIPGWIHAGNLERAREQCGSPAFRNATAEEFNRIIAHDADLRARWRHLR